MSATLVLCNVKNPNLERKREYGPSSFGVRVDLGVKSIHEYYYTVRVTFTSANPITRPLNLENVSRNEETWSLGVFILKKAVLAVLAASRAASTVVGAEISG